MERAACTPGGAVLGFVFLEQNGRQIGRAPTALHWLLWSTCLIPGRCKASPVGGVVILPAGEEHNTFGKASNILLRAGRGGGLMNVQEKHILIVMQEDGIILVTVSEFRSIQAVILNIHIICRKRPRVNLEDLGIRRRRGLSASVQTNNAVLAH